MLNEKELIHPNERKYLTLAIIVSILTYLLMIISISGIIFIIVFLGLTLFAHGIMLALIRTNGIKLSPTQFPTVYEKTKVLCEAMGLKTVPDIYVMESGGVLNGFATKFFGRNMVVLYSEIFELIKRGSEDELAFIIAHELAHIKRRHITKQLVILPVMWVPFLGNAYSRACEFTCDRFGAYYTGNPTAARNSLLILAVGKSLYQEVNQQEFIEQIEKESGFFIWLSQKMSTHPPLPRRIFEIISFENGEITIKSKFKSRILMSLLILLTLASLGYGAKVAVDKLSEFDFSKFTSSDNSALFPALAGQDEEDTPLINAVIEQDHEKLKALITQGQKVNQEDLDGWTALDWAVEDGNLNAVNILVNAGASVNHSDMEKVTPLMRASMYGDIQIMELLLKKGAVLDQQDEYGYTPLIYAAVNEQAEGVKLLLTKGANPQIKTEENYSALMYAIKTGNQDIIKLLRSKEGVINNL
jgi:Zn-dependent protease with chaperone function